MSGNREYKSDVFSMLMEDKKNALEVYNAVNHSNYDDPELVEVHTLDKGVSLSIRNDCAFVLDASLSIYEHQSSVCPNMPVRSLIYFTNILERLLKKRNIYGHSLIRIPIPKFAVFYNGEEWTLSALAKVLLKRNSEVQGTLHFSYRGETISDLRDRLEDDSAG